tara:strand:+ start:237 stop:560 length:324 start_codon:yes stop_codon:yes gene_type:complete
MIRKTRRLPSPEIMARLAEIITTETRKLPEYEKIVKTMWLQIYGTAKKKQQKQDIAGLRRDIAWRKQELKAFEDNNKRKMETLIKRREEYIQELYCRLEIAKEEGLA